MGDSSNFSKTVSVATHASSVVWKCYCSCGGRVGYKESADEPHQCLKCGRVVTQRELATMTGDGLRWERLDLRVPPPGAE